MRYEPATRTKPSASGCQPGVRALADGLRAVFPELQTLNGPYGCYNSRLVAGTRTWSLHAEGRATDTGVTPAHHGLAWQVACHLVDRRTVYGIMRVLWDGHIWSTERPDEWRKLGPDTNAHRDHFHLEVFWAAATKPYATQAPIVRSSLAAARERFPREA